ncbi:hypothetical protein [Massilia sp. HP4]|uniref:hypothetical protein n=1 Tax=Massilia sp. HP4 TaxID=2562316 RepID=UPI001E344265|nr:hypothetical protein [Massilia sp. HP4]
MATFTTRNGAEIYYKDWDRGQAFVFCYAGAPHGLTETHKDRVGADLLAFARGEGVGR